MSYAPIIVVSCALGLTFSVSPMFFNTLPVFLKPLSQEFGWGRTQVIAAISISTLMVALSAPFFGRLIDRFGPRRVILVSTVLLAATIAMMAVTPHSYAAYLAFAALVGLAGTGCNTFAYLAVLPRWFNDRFGMSLGFAMIGIGLGQTIAPIYSNWLIAEFGWRVAYAALGLTVLVVTSSNALFVLRDRQGESDVRRNVAVDVSGLTFSEAIRTVVFWRLFAAFCLITVAVTGCSAHMVPLLTDRGITAGQAANIAGLIGISVLVSRFATGFLLDYVSAAVLGILAFAGTACGIVLLLTGLAGWPVVVGVILCGAALGVEGDLIAYMVRRTFGMRAYGTIYGLLFSAFNLGVVVGPLVMGASFDLTGSYDTGLRILVIPAVLAALLLVRIVPTSELSKTAITTS